jgi:hypothetical protein
VVALQERPQKDASGIAVRRFAEAPPLPDRPARAARGLQRGQRNRTERGSLERYLIRGDHGETGQARSSPCASLRRSSATGSVPAA